MKQHLSQACSRREKPNGSCWQRPSLDLSPQTASLESESSSRQLPTSESRVRTCSAMVAVSAKGVPVGEDSPHSKYLDSEIDRVFELLDAGHSYADTARIMDMPKSTVWAIRNGKMRATTTDRWERRK